MQPIKYVIRGRKMKLQDYSGFLTDELIIEAINSGKIIVSPFDNRNVKIEDESTWPSQLRPAALIFTLDNTYAIIDPRIRLLRAVESVGQHLLWHRIGEDGLLLSPGECIHARTRESIGLDEDILGLMDGLKQNAEKFITVHTTSASWNPGDGGPKDPRGPYKMLLEMTNDGTKPVLFKEGDPICKIIFYKFDKPVRRPYYKIKYAITER